MNAIGVVDRLVSRLPPIARALAAIIVLCGLIGYVVESRARILRSGTEIRLRTVPVDPRDLFRGDYVVLGYEIGTIDPASVTGDRNVRRGETVQVQLAQDADGFARATAIARTRSGLPTGAAGPVIAGRVLSASAAQIRVAYGLESYFVPQGQGLAIERTERKRLEIVAAVSASGEAAIKRLLIDGRLVHAEPPY